jgi:hypothetical protein
MNISLPSHNSLLPSYLKRGIVWHEAEASNCIYAAVENLTNYLLLLKISRHQ